MKKTVKKVKPEKKIKELSTVEKTLAKLTVQQQKEFNDRMQDFAITEMLLAIMEQDKTSVRKLAELSGVSPTVIQSMRSGTKKDYSLTVFLKVLKGLGCKHFKIERNGKYLNVPIQIDIPKGVKKIK